MSCACDQCEISRTGARNRAAASERLAINEIEMFELFRPSGATWTLPKITKISFRVTGTSLAGREPIEHAFLSDASSIYFHAMNIFRGIRAVQAGTTWRLMRDRKRCAKRTDAIRSWLRERNRDGRRAPRSPLRFGDKFRRGRGFRASNWLDRIGRTNLVP